VLTALLFVCVVSVGQAGATLPNDHVEFDGLPGSNASGLLSGYNYYGPETSPYEFCEYGGNSTNMVSQSGQYAGSNCSNSLTSYANDGKPCSGCQDVRLYWGPNYTGAWACITPGWYWAQPGLFGATANHAPLTFSFGSTLSGYGQSVWLNVASLKWTGTCS
jgi:hypothetical protein